MEYVEDSERINDIYIYGCTIQNFLLSELRAQKSMVFLLQKALRIARDAVLLLLHENKQA